METRGQWNPKELIQSEELALLDFQDAIIDEMNRRGVSRSELAELLGVSRARVSQLFASEANPTIKLVGRTLCVLGLRADYIARRKHGQSEPEQIDEGT